MKIFKKREDQDEKLLKNIERYEQKKKAEQQESKILGQKPVNRKANSQKSAIHVASFASGYVRRTKAGGYCPSWQLNKRYKEKEYIHVNDYETGRPVIRTFETKKCKLILDEQDRLEYLISFCLKNYYIGYANKLSNGEFVAMWEYNDAIKLGEEYAREPDVKVIVNGHRYNVI